MIQNLMRMAGTIYPQKCRILLSWMNFLMVINLSPLLKMMLEIAVPRT